MLDIIKILARFGIGIYLCALCNQVALAEAMKNDPSLIGQGVRVGIYDWPVDGSELYTLTRVVDGGEVLERAAKSNVRVLIAMRYASRRHYKNQNGCFSYGRWLSAFKEERLDRIRQFVSNGVIVGFYGPDEPDDWPCGPSPDDLRRICGHVRASVPGLLCGFNFVDPFKWGGEAGLAGIDFLVHQGNFHHIKNWSKWAKEVMDIKLRFPGKIYLSINGYTGNPAHEEISNTVRALCNARPNGVLVWKWKYLQNIDLTDAIKYCASLR